MLFTAKTSQLSIVYAESIQESLNQRDQMLQDLTFWNQFLFQVQCKTDHENLWKVLRYLKGTDNTMGKEDRQKDKYSPTKHYTEVS